MTVGSLFAGIGGFDLAAERVGWEVKWQVEIDPFCRLVLEKHWPAVRRYEDVRKVGKGLGTVDVICGGFPCQDISSVGRRIWVCPICGWRATVSTRWRHIQTNQPLTREQQVASLAFDAERHFVSQHRHVFSGGVAASAEASEGERTKTT